MQPYTNQSPFHISAAPAAPAAPNYQCLVDSVNYSGGIIGAFFDRRQKLQESIQRHNQQGFRLRQVLPAKVSVLTTLVQLLCLAITFLLWALEQGETLILERNL